jgi:hypothetical protein
VGRGAWGRLFFFWLRAPARELVTARAAGWQAHAKCGAPQQQSMRCNAHDAPQHKSYNKRTCRPGRKSWHNSQGGVGGVSWGMQKEVR